MSSLKKMVRLETISHEKKKFKLYFLVILQSAVFLIKKVKTTFLIKIQEQMRINNIEGFSDLFLKHF